jgi:hypothetical protein
VNSNSGDANETFVDDDVHALLVLASPPLLVLVVAMKVVKRKVEFLCELNANGHT